jgi:hypothetical protein
VPTATAAGGNGGAAAVVAPAAFRRRSGAPNCCAGPRARFARRGLPHTQPPAKSLSVDTERTPTLTGNALLMPNESRPALTRNADQMGEANFRGGLPDR